MNRTLRSRLGRELGGKRGGLRLGLGASDLAVFRQSSYINVHFCKLRLCTMEASRALAIVLRELESPALTEARAKLAQVESDAAAKITVLQEQVDELHGQYTICNACARMAQARADDKVRSITAHYESIVDDLWLGNKSLNIQNDSLRERIRELMDGNNGAVLKMLRGAVDDAL